MTLAKSIPQVPQVPQVWYYYNREGVSSCAEPSSHFPCTSEMHIVDTKEYYPYYVWYTFEKSVNGSETELNYKLWYNFNNTEPIVLGSQKCDGKYSTSYVDKNVFEKLGQHFSLSFRHYCNYDSHKNIISDFVIYQETVVNTKLQSNITLADFTHWEPMEYDENQYYEYLPVEEMFEISPPSYSICKFCKK